MRSLLLAAFALVIVSFPPPLSSASDCYPGGAPAPGEFEVSPAGDPRSTIYVDDRNYALGNGLWLYQESNGIFFGGDAARDLQRGGSSFIIPDDNDPCTDPSMNGPDTLIF